MLKYLITGIAVGSLGFTGTASADLIDWEFPVVPNQHTHEVNSNGGGWAHVTVTEDAGDDYLLAWDVDYGLLTSDTTMAHFHGPADFGETAGVTVDMDFSGGRWGNIAGQTQIDGSQLSELKAGLWYINVHTEEYGPAGEIRGQVIPEPGSLALLGAGGLLMLARRRRRC